MKMMIGFKNNSILYEHKKKVFKKKCNYALRNNIKNKMERIKIYKQGRPITKEQGNISDLIREKFGKNAASDYLQMCIRDNQTEEFKNMVASGRVEDIGDIDD